MTLDEASAAVDELERRFVSRFSKDGQTPWPEVCGMLRANLYMALAGIVDGNTLVCPGDDPIAKAVG